MLVDREGLWFRVLAARYGLEHGRLRAGGSRGSVWWRDVVRVRDGVGGPRDGWFGESVTRKVGDGTNTLFWSDPWLGGVPLCERFGRLFDLAATRSSTVAEMYSLGWEVGGAAWEWRRQLWVWEEEMLKECQTLLLPVTLQVDSLDRWLWRPDPVSGYSVRDAYQLLTSQEAVILGEADDLLWHKQVPLKVSIFAWRLLRDRLPTKTNLVTRGILSPDLDTCVTGCGGAESAQHLFLTCGTFGSLWPLVRAGIGVDFRRQILRVSRTILFSSLIQQAVLGPEGLFYSLFGSLVCGLYGMRGTSESSITQRPRCISYWTKSSYFHIGG
ncbi:hypothetical protein QL285_054116 [Trifolium repens]|nr:hypothetical protein QL285_054116 [Trifolium repens]